MRSNKLALALVMVLAAGCSADAEEEDTVSTLESELAVNEIVTAGTVLKVTASSLNLRSAPRTNASVLASLDEGTKVTCTETSGEEGWVKVKTSGGKVGWVFGKYVVRDEVDQESSGSGSESSESSGGSTNAPTCSPSRATGAVSRYQKALHDVIAFAEGTRNYSKDGYNVLFSHRTVSSCRTHPNQCIAFGSTCSTAAGRYQFLTTTWNIAKRARGLSSFEPENQERAAAYLISNTRRVTIPQSRAMTATEFSNAMSKLSYEWASLPPGRYGQPTKTMSQVRSLYCTLAGC